MEIQRGGDLGEARIEGKKKARYFDIYLFLRSLTTRLIFTFESTPAYLYLYLYLFFTPATSCLPDLQRFTHGSDAAGELHLSARRRQWCRCHSCCCRRWSCSAGKDLDPCPQSHFQKPPTPSWSFRCGFIHLPQSTCRSRGRRRYSRMSSSFPLYLLSPLPFLLEFYMFLTNFIKDFGRLLLWWIALFYFDVFTLILCWLMFDGAL